MRAFPFLALLALLLPSLSQANDGRDTRIERVPTGEARMSHAKWVKAEEAGYYPLSAESQPVNGPSLSFVAGKGSAAPFFLIENTEEWKALLEKIVGDDQKPPAFAPDFRRESLLVVFHPNDGKKTLPLVDIEVYETKAGLSGFVFQQSPGEPRTDDMGWYFVTTIPKRLANRAVELRFAHQSWGRVCSTFGPSVRLSARAAN